MSNSNTNKEATVECPECGESIIKRGLFAHVFQSSDEAHGERFTVPDDFDVEEAEEIGEEDVELDYPEQIDLDEQYYLDTYTGKAYEGARGLMVHLGQMAGQNNIPEDVAERHEARDFPEVEIDDDGNITEVISWQSDDVPPLESYLPWFTDEERGFVSKQEIKEFAEKLEDTTGAASAETIREELL
jgi:hypothetical protein